MFYKNLKFLIMLINRHSNQNKDSFVSQSFPPYVSVLNLLVSAGCVRGYNIFYKHTCRGHIKPFVRVLLKKPTPFGLVLKPYPFRFETRNLNRHKLVLLIKKYPSSTFILNTQHGLLTQNEALKKNIFGTLLFKLN